VSYICIATFFHDVHDNFRAYNKRNSAKQFLLMVSKKYERKRKKMKYLLRNRNPLRYKTSAVMLLSKKLPVEFWSPQVLVALEVVFMAFSQARFRT
jgi:hypothetical protein